MIGLHSTLQVEGGWEEGWGGRLKRRRKAKEGRGRLRRRRKRKAEASVEGGC